MVHQKLSVTVGKPELNISTRSSHIAVSVLYYSDTVGGLEFQPGADSKVVTCMNATLGYW